MLFNQKLTKKDKEEYVKEIANLKDEIEIIAGRLVCNCKYYFFSCKLNYSCPLDLDNYEFDSFDDELDCPYWEPLEENDE